MPEVRTVPNASPRLSNRACRLAARTSSLALAIAFATPSFAHSGDGASRNEQPAPAAEAAAPEATTNTAQIGDITVTARRVRERLQDIPASVTAVTGEQATRLRSLADLQSAVSGVTFQTTGPIPAV